MISKIKTRLDVALEALEEITNPFFAFAITLRVYAKETLKELESMPDENCANCKNSVFCKIRNQLLCIGNEMRGRITEKDFCSRWKPKEKPNSEG